MKKMILIDPNLLEQLKQRQSRVVTDIEKQMDKSMEEDLPIRERVKDYNHHLSQLRTINEKQGPKQVPEPAPPSIEHDVLESVPIAMRKRARLLLDRVKHKIGWNEKGEVIVRGRLIPGTHIVDLVNDALRQRKRHPTPSGRTEFAREVREIGFPHEIIQNPIYRATAEKEAQVAQQAEEEEEEEGEEFQDSFADWDSYKK
jgi:hypothetical protein